MYLEYCVLKMSLEIAVASYKCAEIYVIFAHMTYLPCTSNWYMWHIYLEHCFLTRSLEIAVASQWRPGVVKCRLTDEIYIIWLFKYVCMSIYKYTCQHITLWYMCCYTSAHICLNVHVNICIWTNTYTSTYIHIYVFICI